MRQMCLAFPTKYGSNRRHYVHTGCNFVPYQQTRQPGSLSPASRYNENNKYLACCFFHHGTNSAMDLMLWTIIVYACQSYMSKYRANAINDSSKNY